MYHLKVFKKMKKVNSFLIAAFVAASALLVTSCSDDDDEDDSPSIEVKATYGDQNGIKVPADGSITALEGTVVTLDITYTMGVSRLTNVKLKSKVGNRSSTTVLDSTLNEGISLGAKQPIKFQYRTTIGNDNEELTLEAVDRKPRTSTFVLTLTRQEPTVVGGGDKLAYYPVTIDFGCQGHATNPSFYSITNAKGMMLSEARTNSANVDFVFYHESNVKVGCPSDSEAANVSFGSSKLSAILSTKNTVNFSEALDLPSEDDLTVAWWDEQVSAALTATNVVLTTPNKVYFYKKGSTVGAFVVETISPTDRKAGVKVKFIVKQ